MTCPLISSRMRASRRRHCAAHDDRHDVATAAVHRGDEIEAGGAGVAGLDAVDAFHAPEQTVVIADPPAAEAEGAGREIRVVAREALLDRAPSSDWSRAVVTCSSSGRPDAFLYTVRLMPSDRAFFVISSAKSSSSPAIASATTTDASLADRVMMPLIASSTTMVPPAFNPSLVGDCEAACSDTLSGL